MKNYDCCLFVIFVLCALLLNPALADEIHLTNGDRLSGRLIHFSPAFCIFKPLYAENLQIETNRVFRVSTTQPVTVELNSGDRIRDKLITDDKKTIFLNSRTLGTLIFKIEDVAQISSLDYSTTGSELLMAQGKGTEQSPEQKPPPPETIGEEPEEDIRQIFLRRSSVLLKPGEVELDSTIDYVRDDRNFLLPAGNQLIPVDVIDRRIRLSNTLRVGVLDELELFVNVPVAWVERELQFPDNTNDKDSDVGVGDISAGLKYRLIRESRNWPDIVWSSSFRAPTGEDPNPSESSEASVGNGNWQISNRFNFLKSFDPVVLFAGIGYRYTFDRTLNDVDVEFSDIFDYSFGLGFAINDQITVSGQVLGAYQTEVEFDNRTVTERGREPIAFRSSLTFRIAKGHYIEPFVTFGLNDDASEVDLGFSYTFKLL